MRVSIYRNPKKVPDEIYLSVVKKVKDAGFVIDDFTPEIVIHLGGDGTLLKAVNQYIDIVDKISFVGLKYGQLGFFYEYDLSEIDRLLTDLNANRYLVNKFHLLEADICKGDKTEVVYAVNEIRIENPFKTLVCDVFINDEHLETFRGSGLLISSTLGSSAYNKSLGGSLIDHNLDCIELTEIAPIHSNVEHSLGSSLVLSNNKEITFKTDYKNVVLGYDRLTMNDGNIDLIKIKSSKKIISILKRNRNSYLNTLKNSFIR